MTAPQRMVSFPRCFTRAGRGRGGDGRRWRRQRGVGATRFAPLPCVVPAPFAGRDEDAAGVGKLPPGEGGAAAAPESKGHDHPLAAADAPHEGGAPQAQPASGDGGHAASGRVGGLPVIRDRMHIASLLDEVSTRVADMEMAAAPNRRSSPIPVAVLVCGPAAMVDGVFEAVRRINADKNPHRAVFHVHRETFDM